MDDMLGAPTPDQVLSQSEVENLLAQVAEQENSVTVHSDGGASASRSRDAVQPYDFRHPVFLSPSELRRLRLRHEDFIRALAARLSLHLRIEFSLQMSKLQTVLFRKFTEGLPNPTYLSLFKADPLPGICILEINPRLALTMVDRLLGGPAHSVNATHDFTEIELALMEQAVQVVLSEWCTHWRGVQDLRPVTLGHETNGQFIQTAAHDTVMLILSMEARVGDCMETMQLAFPYYTLEPLIRTLNQMLESAVGQAPGSGRAAPKWNPQFDDVRVPVTAAWPDLELAAREVASLRVGDILELSPACLEKVSVRLADTPRFRGRLGTRGKHWAVELTETLKR